MRLYGGTWTRRGLEARVGRLEQAAGIQRLQWVEGLEAGVEQILVRTGAGLSYYVSPSRCLDISLAEFGGVPISWQAANGDVHPAYYNARGMEWLRTAAGGLLMTCGLTHAGAPCDDEGRHYGLHGRAHHLPARHIAAEGRWHGDEYEMRVSGIVDEAEIFGEHLRLTREIRSWLGENRIAITDEVTNVGFASTPHMILYHFNFGFPLLTEETEIRFPSQRVVPREPETPLVDYERWQAPEAGFRERVYYHEDSVLDDGSNDTATAVIHNPRFPAPGGTGAHPLTVRLRWSTRHLPRLVQWRMPGAGVHVLGIEPANCYPEGRTAERARGSLVMLEPGELLRYELEFEVSASESDD